MAIHAAEEETIEELKKWWDENGKRLLLLVILVLGSYSSWMFWQNSRNATIEAASDLYEDILTIATPEPGETVSDEDGPRILDLAAQLRNEHDGSIYAAYGSLFSAQQSVRNNDLDGAETALQWILDNQTGGMFSDADEGLILATNLRLGRVILAKGDAERALALVNNIDPKSFEGGFAELRGDIYVSMGREVDARDAYIAAQQAGSNNNALRMKLDDLPAES